MPKFSSQELEEIKQNTRRIEAEIKEKRSSAAKSSRSSSKSAKQKKLKAGDPRPLRERVIALILLVITIGVSYIVLWWNQK